MLTHVQAGSQTCQHSEPHQSRGHTLTRTRLAQLLSHHCHYWMVFEALAEGEELEEAKGPSSPKPERCVWEKGGL